MHKGEIIPRHFIYLKFPLCRPPTQCWAGRYQDEIKPWSVWHHMKADVKCHGVVPDTPSQHNQGRGSFHSQGRRIPNLKQQLNYLKLSC